jgi:hypothetical protein
MLRYMNIVVVPSRIELELDVENLEKLEGGVKRDRKSIEMNYSYIGRYIYLTMLDELSMLHCFFFF